MARRRIEEEHENHERWLVSYADFITLLFAFFVVMYSISSINEGKYKVLTDSLRQMEDDGLVFRHDYGENPPRVEYGLTELGRQMMPIMDSLADFGAYYKTVVS